MPYNHPRYEQFNFNRSPSWRFDRACYLVDKGSRLDPGKDDDLTLRAVHYLRALGPARRLGGLDERLSRCHPDLHAAHCLHHHGGELRWELEARLLARQTSREIARVLPLDAAVIDAYEAYFFCVRDRLDASDWIGAKVIGPGPRRGFANDLPGLWRAVAYAGGPLPLDVVIVCTSAIPRRASFPQDLLRQARRLVDALMLPADASLSQLMALREELASRSAKASRAATTRKALLDDIATVIGGSVDRPRAAEAAASAAHAPRSRPELGETPIRGATRGAA